MPDITIDMQEPLSRTSEITVDIQHPVYIDGIPEDVYGFIIRAPSTVAESGEAYVAFILERLDQMGERYIKNAAFSLSRFNHEPERETDYCDAIEAKVLEALASVA